MKFIFSLLLLNAIKPIVFAVQKCEKDFFQTIYRNGNGEESDALLIWFPTDAGSDSQLLRLCSNETGLPLKRHCNYQRSLNSGQWEDINHNISLVPCDSIIRQCPEEPFRHNYVMKNGVLRRHENKWKTAQMLENADLEEPCLQSSGLPLTRRCSYNPALLKAEWEPINENLKDFQCLKEIRENIITYDLNSLYEEVKKNITSNETVNDYQYALKKMSELLTTPSVTLVPADIKISSEILNIATKNLEDLDLITYVLNTADIIMGSDPRVVRKSEDVNATKTLQNTIENYLHNIANIIDQNSLCESFDNGVFYEALKYTSVYYIVPSCSNISGIAIFKSRRHNFDSNTDNYYRFLYLNQSLEEITKEPDLRLATYFPLSLWERLQTETETVNQHTVLTFILYRNDLLFNGPTVGYRAKNRVLDIKIPDFSGELPEDIPFIFSNGHGHSQENAICGFWNHSKRSWISNGVKTQYENNSAQNLLICHSTHLTNFAALVGISVYSVSDPILLNIEHEKMLDYISLIGCTLSLFGLVCIWLTAICFRSWREKPSNRVLLNVSLVLSFIMAFFLLLNLPDPWKTFIQMENHIHCMIIGAFLHYNILVLFMWMLIIAIMQYQRYVIVLGYERLSIKKFVFVAWVLPLIPTLLVAYLDPHTYMPSAKHLSDKTGICYPSGNCLYYGVILPMAAIVLANLFIFFYIFYKIRHSLNKFKRSTKHEARTQIRLSILLFFLLGISWIFGLLSHLESSPVFSYLFCLTSTLQGFVLFIYFIIIDETTRYDWLICCGAKNYYPNDETKMYLAKNLTPRKRH